MRLACYLAGVRALERPGNEVSNIRVVYNWYEIRGYVNGVEVYWSNQTGELSDLTGVGLLMRPSYYNAIAEARYDNFDYRFVPIPQSR